MFYVGMKLDWGCFGRRRK